jgi:anti-sigma regulatory factor (Ser/Thr protein kinase)
MPKATAPTALQRSLPASAAALPRLRGLVRSFAAGRCGADADQAAMIALAVTEAATNVVLHAYPDRPGMINLLAEVDDGRLHVRIADAGVGMRPSRQPGIGAGLRIMEGLAETEVVSQPGQGTAVDMVFRLSEPCATPRPASAEPPPHPPR